MRQIISGNLNTLGNNGNFETDSSTWGFSTECVRSSEQATKGIYSAKFTATEYWGSLFPGTDLAYLSNIFVHGKKYLLKAKVRTKAATPPASVNCKYQFNLDGQTPITNVQIPVNDAADEWVSLEASFQFDNTVIAIWGSMTLMLFGYVFGGDQLILGGVCYVDEVECYEYIDVAEPTGCDTEINPASVVTNETAPGANNGSINVAVTSSASALEYSKDDGVTYQPAALFAGLGTNIFIIKVRDQALPSCFDRYPFAVNHSAPTFDFSAVVTNESISGAHDGAITLTPSNNTSEPYDFSIDGGVTWQKENNFPGLAPGEYFAAVRGTYSNAVVKVYTITAGAIEFDKVYHSGNPVTFEKIAGAGWESKLNFRLYDDIRVEDVADSGNYNSKLKVELPPDETGKAIFYLQEAFSGVFKFIPPVLNASEIIRLTDRIKRFKNYTGELEGTETAPVVITQSLPSLVLYGGIGKFHYPDLNFFTSYLQANKKFLSWCPRVKYVDKNQEDYLNFYVYGNFTTLTIHITAYFDDGTTSELDTKTKAGTAFSELYQIPVGPVNSGATLVDPAKNLVSYDLELRDQTGATISEKKTYLITTIRHPLTRFIMFLNSLGSFEVVRATGQAVQTNQFKKELIQKFLPHDYKAIDGEFEINSAFVSRVTNYSSGYITGRFSAEWHEYLQDLRLSPRVYDVTDGRRLPLAVLEGEHSTQDQDYIRFIRVDAKQAYDDNFFTPARIL